MCEECKMKYVKSESDREDSKAKKEHIYCIHAWLDAKLEMGEKYKKILKPEVKSKKKK
jgi:hypothetical protein